MSRIDQRGIHLIAQAANAGTRVLASRRELAQYLRGVGVEVGVAHGEFSEYLLANSGLATLYSVDPWDMSSDAHPNQQHADNVYDLCVRALAPFKQRSVIVRERGELFVERLGKETVDFVYLDASHTYADTFLQCCLWWRALRVGGIMAGHDFANCLEVRRGVDLFCKMHGGQRYTETEDDGGHPFRVSSWVMVKGA